MLLSFDKEAHDYFNDYWTLSKSLLSNVQSFLKTIVNFDVDKITTKTLEQLRKDIISRPDFKPERVHEIFSAAKDICAWAVAAFNYADAKKKHQKCRRDSKQGAISTATINHAIRLDAAHVDDSNSVDVLNTYPNEPENFTQFERNHVSTVEAGSQTENLSDSISTDVRKHEFFLHQKVNSENRKKSCISFSLL
jgi:hypothetical protein